MGQFNLKLEFNKLDYSDYLSYYIIQLNKEIERDEQNFSRIFIHYSLIRKWDLQVKNLGEEINVSFSDWDYLYSPFYYYDKNTGERTLELGVFKKIENEWRLKIEGLFKGFEEFNKTYEKIVEKITKKETIRELISEITYKDLRELREALRNYEIKIDNLSSQIELVRFRKEVFFPTKKLSEKLTVKKQQLLNILKNWEINYQLTNDEELKELLDRIKEIQELLNFFLANEITSPEEIVEINRLLGRFQEICRKTEEFIQNRPPTPPVTFPESQKEEQEIPIEHSEDPKDESPKDQKNSSSKPLIFLLIIVVAALIFIPIYYFFFTKRKPTQTHKKKTFKHTIS